MSTEPAPPVDENAVLIRSQANLAQAQALMHIAQTLDVLLGNGIDRAEAVAFLSTGNPADLATPRNEA